MADQMVSNGKNVRDYTVGASGGLTRERSFVRNNTNQQNHQNKRRSLAFNQQSTNITHQQYQDLQQQQLRAKPAMEIYRPPSNLQFNFNIFMHFNWKFFSNFFFLIHFYL